LHASTCAQCHLWCFLLWMCLHRFFFLCAFAHAQWHLLFHVFIFSFHNWSIKSKLTMEGKISIKLDKELEFFEKTCFDT
jgi:hypothetical protein